MVVSVDPSSEAVDVVNTLLMPTFEGSPRRSTPGKGTLSRQGGRWLSLVGEGEIPVEPRGEARRSLIRGKVCQDACHVETYAVSFPPYPSKISPAGKGAFNYGYLHTLLVKCDFERLATMLQGPRLLGQRETGDV